MMLGLRALASPFPAGADVSIFSTSPQLDPFLTTRLLRPTLRTQRPQLFPSAATTVRRPGLLAPCRARRRIRYGDDDDAAEQGGSGDSDGHNADLAVLEAYSEGARGAALLVRAEVDGEEEEVLVFRGFSSLLSSGTFSDPSRSVLPARAVIKAVDVLKGPFDPSDIQYVERGLTLEDIKARIG